MAKHRTTGPNVPAPQVDDAEVFRAAVRDVKPIKQTGPDPGLIRVKPSTRLRRAGSIAPDRDVDMPLLGDCAASGMAGSDPVVFQRPGVRTQVVRRLRRGLFPIEAELDLHGLSQAAARDQLAEFLLVSYQAGMRCVRIIHGKGFRSGARGPVLKVAVDSWLRRHLDVMAFTSARAIDGGTGAVYVLLRA